MKVYLDMVGCRLNQSEIEKYSGQFRHAGHTLTSNAGSADLVVINTCTVTAAAASDSRQKIRQAAKAGANQIIVTGCYATLNTQETASLPGVTRVIGNLNKDNLVPIVLNIPFSSFDHTSIRREPLPGARLRTRAFIKVQDGCDNHCTYCITTLARGASRSRPINDILRDIHSALDGGSQEIVLTGVHLGSWGYDFAEPLRLQTLVSAILEETSTPRLRLSSLEPWDISPKFFELWHDSRLCRHLHLPLQSGCAGTLKRMGRKITLRDYTELIRQARIAIPDVAITTDIITGFPGETEDEFSESADFVKAMKFTNGHVFSFSPRPGTAAANLPNKINPSLAKLRNAMMRQILQHSAYDYSTKYLDQYLPVLWEKATPLNDRQWQLSGYSDNYLRIRATCLSPCRNQITDVHITSLEPDGLVGEIPPDHNQASGDLR
jgi:threonylcarbamoyladenosine tRNA methylthiotransferase MtaB